MQIEGVVAKQGLVSFANCLIMSARRHSGSARRNTRSQLPPITASTSSGT
jgi:hypothetical protein